MAPKKDKGKKEEDAATTKQGGFTEVEKTFLELQVTECNRKIARLRAAVDEYEVRNEELQKAYDKLDEDRADIIAYLKKTLNSKNEENIELKDKVKGLEETREIETKEFKETVAELEKNFTIMKDQLTSENKLMAGKLNTLEEFRAIRDDLMRKFEKQEQDFKDQEMKYKRVIYDAEKKFIVSKDKLKKEMEARLLQLAQDFQDATELRIAASTHRVIRENIAINNELDSILATQAKLSEQNEKYKENERAARIAKELADEERDKAINKNVVQLKVIDQLTTAFQTMKKEKALFEKKNYDFETQQAIIQKLTKENENLSLQVRILEQNLHAKMTDQNKASIEASKTIKETKKLRTILKEAAISVKAALKLDQWAATDPTRDVMDRQALLSRLLEIITQYREIQQAESTETLASLEKIYQEGDLGFIPKPVGKRSMISTSVSTTSRESSVWDGRRSEAHATSISSSTLGSVKTVPSIKLIPASSQPEIAEKESLPSFVTSSKSSVSESAAEEEEEETTDIGKLLEKSKLEIQKSIFKDLEYSQIAMKSQLQLSEDAKRRSKDQEMRIDEGDEEAKADGEKVEGEQAADGEDGVKEGEAETDEVQGEKDDQQAKEDQEGKEEPAKEE